MMSMRTISRPEYTILVAEPFEASRLDGFKRAEIDDDLLPLDALRGLTTVAPNDSGIYFLWRHAQLLYIGYSAFLEKRIWNHEQVRRGIWDGGARRYPFTHATCLVLPMRGLEALEYRYINAYRPPFNARHEDFGSGRRAGQMTPSTASGEQK